MEHIFELLGSWWGCVRHCITLWPNCCSLDSGRWWTLIYIGASELKLFSLPNLKSVLVLLLSSLEFPLHSCEYLFPVSLFCIAVLSCIWRLQLISRSVNCRPRKRIAALTEVLSTTSNLQSAQLKSHFAITTCNLALAKQRLIYMGCLSATAVWATATVFLVINSIDSIDYLFVRVRCVLCWLFQLFDLLSSLPHVSGGCYYFHL